MSTVVLTCIIHVALPPRGTTSSQGPSLCAAMSDTRRDRSCHIDGRGVESNGLESSPTSCTLRKGHLVPQWARHHWHARGGVTSSKSALRQAESHRQRHSRRVRASGPGGDASESVTAEWLTRSLGGGWHVCARLACRGCRGGLACAKRVSAAQMGRFGWPGTKANAS